MWGEILTAVQVNLQWSHLMVVLIGTVAGMIIGALPGLSAVSGVALLLPFTFTMEPAQGLIMLAAVYMSAEYGGSISAILINTPGTSGAACTTLDGTPLTRLGYAQEALYTSLLAGTVGGVFGAAVLLLFTPPLAEASLLLGPAEIFWVAVAGLALVASLSGRHTVKGLIGVTLGVGLTLIGQDAMSGDMRFTFDNYHLVGGIPIVPALLGLFAVATILELLERSNEPVAPLVMHKGALRFVCAKLMKMKGLLVYTSALGTAVGVIPGAGASISAFVAYAEAKRISKHPEAFGHGSYEGIAAPECANNAVVGGALVPLLALGIPGSGSAAIMFSALTVHGLLPGPRLFTERADVAYTFMVGLMVTVFAMLLVGLVTIRWSSLVVKAPRRLMVPAVLVLSVIGTYGYANSLFDVTVLIAMGIGGYLLTKLDVPMVTIALGIVLGALVEESFQQSAIVGEVDVGSVWAYFLGRPLAVALMLLALGVALAGVRQMLRGRTEPDSEALPAHAAVRAGPSLRVANIVLGGVFVAVAGYVLLEARSMSDMGGRFPVVVAGMFIVLGTLLFAVNVNPATGRRRAGISPFQHVPWGRWWFVVSALVLLGLGATWVGFYESALVFLFAVAWCLSADSPSSTRRVLDAALFAIAYDLVIYGAFKLVLQIPTPPGLLV